MANLLTNTLQQCIQFWDFIDSHKYYHFHQLKNVKAISDSWTIPQFIIPYWRKIPKTTSKSMFKWLDGQSSMPKILLNKLDLALTLNIKIPIILNKK